jgi:hypothetical protein
MSILNKKMIEEEITLAEFSERFLLNSDFKTPATYDLTDYNIQVETPGGFKLIKSFLIKEPETCHYTDGKLKGTASHRIFENGNDIFLKNHSEFKLVDEPIDVVDIEVDGEHYLANGRINHNTTSGGKALAFHASIRVRMTKLSQIKNTKGDVIGFSSEAKVFKNRLGPPMRKASFDLFFDRGMDNYGSWFKTVEDEKIAEKAKTQEQKKKLLQKDEHALDNYVQIDGAGKKLQFQSSNGKIYEFTKSSFSNFLRENPTVREEIYNKICESKIMIYKDQSMCESDNLIYEEGED